MSVERLPTSAWVLAWTCLAGQVVDLVLRGPSQADAGSVGISMALSALVVGWVSAGVLRARPVRFWFAAIVLGVVAVLSLVAVVVQIPSPDASDLLGALVVGAQLGALVALSRSAYFRAQRAEPRPAGPDITGLVLVAVVVGVLGGFTAPSTGEDSPHRYEIRM